MNPLLDNTLSRISSNRTNILIGVMAVLILIFGGYAMTGYLVSDNPGSPNTPDKLAPVEITTFTDSGGDICLEDGKPVITLFSTTWCPHCKWIGSTFDKVVNEYVEEGMIVAHHWQLDTKDDTLTPETEGQIPDEELAVYNRFNPRGSIPTFVFGCRYSRIGNGHESQGDLAAEEAEFRAVIDKLIEESGR